MGRVEREHQGRESRGGKRERMCHIRKERVLPKREKAGKDGEKTRKRRGKAGKTGKTKTNCRRIHKKNTLTS